jgi:hypothetical protein
MTPSAPTASPATSSPPCARPPVATRFHISGVKRYHHRQVGDPELNYERLEVVFDTGLTIFTYTADPGTRSAEALGLLGSLAATTAAESTSPAPDARLP